MAGFHHDETKFGQKLMEKMGWSKGRGLGANEDGKTESIAVSLKNNTRGVGWTKKTEDNWIAHQDDFTALLSSLNENHRTSSPGSGEVETHKVMSLEQTSRSSKGRVHYQKFTKGKDLSLRSKTDLNCVFGKRKLVANEGASPQPLNKVESDNPSNDERDNEDCGLKTVTSSDSVQDYFAKKMAALKSKRDTASGVNGLIEGTDNCSERFNTDVSETTPEVHKEKKKKRKSGKKDEMHFFEGVNESKESDDEVVKADKVKIEPNDMAVKADEVKIGSKKRKRNEKEQKVRFSIGNDESNEIQENKIELDEYCETSKKRKIGGKKLKVRFSLGEDELEKVDEKEPLLAIGDDKVVLDSNEHSTVKTDDLSVKKKKKKSKKKKMDIDENDNASQEVEYEPAVDVVENTSNETADTPLRKTSKKKSRKNKFTKMEEDKDDDETLTETSLVENMKTDLNDEEVSSKVMNSEKDILDHEDDIKECNILNVKDVSVKEQNVQEDSSIKTKKPKKRKRKSKGQKIDEKSKKPKNFWGPEAMLLRYATEVKEDVNFVMSNEGTDLQPIYNIHTTIGSRVFENARSTSKTGARKEAASLAIKTLKAEGKQDLFIQPKSDEPEVSVDKRNKNEKAKTSADGPSHDRKFPNSFLGTIKGYPGLPVKKDYIESRSQFNRFQHGPKTFHSSFGNSPQVLRDNTGQTFAQRKHVKF